METVLVNLQGTAAFVKGLMCKFKGATKTRIKICLNTKEFTLKTVRLTKANIFRNDRDARRGKNMYNTVSQEKYHYV